MESARTLRGDVGTEVVTVDHGFGTSSARVFPGFQAETVGVMA